MVFPCCDSCLASKATAVGVWVAEGLGLRRLWSLLLCSLDPWATAAPLLRDPRWLKSGFRQRPGAPVGVRGAPASLLPVLCLHGCFSPTNSSNY